MNMIKPFLKWAGGKTQLLEVLELNLPNMNEITTYIEPFVGAGALFFYLVEKYEFDNIIINDLNSKLINTYMIIRDDCNRLIYELNYMKKEYLNFTEEKKKIMYYIIREEMNDWNCVSLTKQAANFIFLNKTCFNGLYRENKSGEFNVPWGQQLKPSFFDETLLKSISKVLNTKEVKILNESYECIREFADENTLVYFDPPYRPITKGGFNEYNKSGFNDDAQIKLNYLYRELDSKGVKLMLSNSDPKNLDKDDLFFDILYNEYNIQRVNANRMINSNGKGRKAITELLIKNY